MRMQQGDQINDTNRVIVKYNNSYMKKQGIDNVNKLDSSISIDMESLKVPAGETVEGFIDELKKNDNVEFVEPDYKLQKLYIPNDPYYSRQWHHSVINTGTAWQKTKGSDSITVAVIDDGVQLDHPDLINQITAPFNVIGMTSATIPAGDHGTHVSGIIAGSIENNQGGTGVAPQVRLMPINVFSGDDAYMSDVIKGINHAIEHGADIINLSLGTYSYSLALDEAIQEAYSKGALFISAAGNDAVNEKSYPASIPNVISVSSTDNTDAKSAFSNFGEEIDIAAPGSDIVSTLVNGYGYMSGTSMAAPVVSGVAALIWSSDPELTNLQVMNRLLHSSDDIGTTGKDTYFGYGRVNAAKALNSTVLEQPYVENINNDSHVVTGIISAGIEGGRIILSNDQAMVADSYVDSNKRFQVQIPAANVNEQLYIRLTDKYGNSSDRFGISTAQHSGWVLIGGKWKYYDPITGQMKIGFSLIIGNWYFLDSNGDMVTGWRTIDGIWHYFNDGGNMHKGWLYNGDSWYYLDQEGKMKTGWVYIGSSWYFFNETGRMQTGWLYTNGAWYYLDAGGSMRTGWIFTNGAWYYLNEGGSMQTGWLYIDGAWYFLNEGGSMQTGWLYINGAWYFFNESGSMQTGWLYINGAWYFFNESGSMQTGWIYTDDTWYFLDENGRMQ
ncbi:S8 family serine peptidase [Bacillus sp. T33-2]|uniref:S8 family serine peptidase n=1 Tax=Bacillus sp. T33-2 TaxID=2054168 RepID=UPI0015E0C907|nr:S8 family serine peptidase [Bacillus sp. T33-2]